MVIDDESYWSRRYDAYRTNHYYRLFSLLVANRIQFLSKFDGIVADATHAKSVLEAIQGCFHDRGITFYAVPYDILALLVIAHLGPDAYLDFGIYAWKPEILDSIMAYLNSAKVTST
ncbi:MAG: hypothetical protein ACYC96_15555 [Fimbriimonadaceae bacterium]